jgi:hypothetical protein
MNPQSYFKSPSFEGFCQEALITFEGTNVTLNPSLSHDGIEGHRHPGGLPAACREARRSARRGPLSLARSRPQGCAPTA